jgi:hypothetical protein
MNRWRVGEDKGSKENDRCPLTLLPLQSAASRCVKTARRLPGPLSKWNRVKDGRIDMARCAGVFAME